MKFFLLNIALIVALHCSAQSTHDEFKGHWHFCHPSQEYSEVLITDSLIDLLNFDMFGVIPIQYSFEDGFALSNRAFKDDESQWTLHQRPYSDTLVYEPLSSNQMVIFWYGRNDTLTRLKEKPTNFYDYNCSAGMSIRNFESVLLYEFEKRKIKANLHCTPSILTSIETKDNTIYNLEVDWEQDTITPHVSAPYVEYQYIDVDSTKLTSPKFVFEKWNPDSSICLVVIDYFGSCYDEYARHAKIDATGALSLVLQPRNFTQCFDRCAMRFYFELSIRNFTFEEILLNGKRINW